MLNPDLGFNLPSFVIPPWLKWLGALLVVAAVVIAIYSYGRQQFGLGEQAEKARWLARETAELAAANVKINALQTAARTAERDHAMRLAAVSAQYQEDLKHAQARKDRVIADLRTGAQRLRIPVAGAGCAGAGGMPETGPATGGRDGGTTAELSQPAAEFLVGLASDADQVAEQLKACQALVREDRNQQP